MNAVPEWQHLMTILQWILGGLGTLVASALWIIWCGGRWTGRIEHSVTMLSERVEQYNESNTDEHQRLWDHLEERRRRTNGAYQKEIV